MNIVKSLTIASLVFSLAFNCLQTQAQTHDYDQLIAIPPQLIHEMDIDPNQLPEIPPATVAALPDHCKPHRVTGISLNSNGTLMAVAITSGGSSSECLASGFMQIFAISTRESPRLLYIVHSKYWVDRVAFNPNGTRLAVGVYDSNVHIFKGMIPFTHLQTLPEARADIGAIAFNPFGTQLAVGG